RVPRLLSSSLLVADGESESRRLRPGDEEESLSHFETLTTRDRKERKGPAQEAVTCSWRIDRRTSPGSPASCLGPSWSQDCGGRWAWSLVHPDLGSKGTPCAGLLRSREHAPQPQTKGLQYRPLRG